MENSMTEINDSFEVKNEIHPKPEKKKRGPYMTKARKAALSFENNEPLQFNKSMPFPAPEKKIGIINFDELNKTYEQNLDADADNNGEIIDAKNTIGSNPAVNITGDMLLALIDTIAPIVAVIGTKILTKGKKKIKISSMRLTAEEKEILQSSADAAANEILGNLTPVQLFIFTLLSIYGGKVIEQIAIEK